MLDKFVYYDVKEYGKYAIYVLNNVFSRESDEKRKKKSFNDLRVNFAFQHV